MHSIPRKRGPDEHGFEQLRSKGVRLVSQLSGNQWTDYNLHDPGITILEQLCFALTDLVFRARLPVEDHLTGEDGRIAFEDQALHRPEAIFPSRPATPDDHRRAILARVPEVEDVWITPSPDHQRIAPDGASILPGVYRVRVRLADTQRPQAEVIAHVRSVVTASRNLGEDMEAEVRVASGEACHLLGQIGIRGVRSAEDILGEIYVLVERYVASAEPEPMDDDGDPERSLDEVFTGPYPGAGIHEAPRERDQDKIHVADIVSLIRGVDGVVSVPDVALVIGGRAHRDSVDRTVGDVVRYLEVPRTASDDAALRLVREGRPVQVAPSFWYKYRQLGDARRRRSRSILKPHSLYREPRGQHRGVEAYHSIQHGFPAVYGVNAEGVPDSAPPADKARVAQLKAYLLPLEQLMADYLANLSQVRTLFSVRDTPRRTYFFQTLGDGEVPNVEGLYREPPDEFLAKVYRGADDYGERKSRVLDHMLAIYGETFDDAAFRDFDHGYGAERGLDAVVRNKLAFLRRIAEVGRNRGSGFDYSRASWNEAEARPDLEADLNVSGLQHRVGLLLGFTRPSNRSLVDALTEQGLRLVPHDRYSEAMAGRPQLELVDIDDTYAPVPERGTAAEINVDALRRLVVPLRSTVISDALFTGGLDPSRFRLGVRGDRHVLVFQSDDVDRWWYMGDYPTQTGGWSAANALRRYLVRLNLECEGFHVVEHVLLRPEGGAELHRGVVPAGGRDLWSDFYPSRVSVLFSGWTARCRDEKFRLLAEETVRLNCPAHVHPECYWLDFDEMSAFEKPYRLWLDRKADEAASADARDSASVPVIESVLAVQAKRDSGGAAS